VGTEATFAARYGLTPEQEAWRARAEAFARHEAAPKARASDRERRFDLDLVRALGREGLIGVGLPKALGGAGAGALAAALVAEELGAADASLRGFLAVQAGLVCTPLAQHGTAEQRGRWLARLLEGEAVGCYALTEPEAGSDVGSIATRVRQDGDAAVLDGEKVWITNGGVADVALVFAQAEPGAGRKGLECWLVPGGTPGLTTQPLPGRELGHRASNHARLVLSGVRVPRSARLGPARGGHAIAMLGLEVGRLNVAAGAVGIHRAALEAATSFARTRRQFGQRIGDFQMVGADLADMAADLEAARLLVHHAARLKDRELPCGEAVAKAKLFATEAALRAATKAVQLHGARGYSDEHPVERHYRDAIALTIYEGTSHIQRLILARDLLGRDTPSAPPAGPPA
jgi:alkylation response protein AidB-like acyl-CoA dehydrogenase